MKRDKSKERKGDSSESKSEEKNTKALAISDDDVLFVGDKECLNVASDDCHWVIDSDASYHLTPHHDYSRPTLVVILVVLEWEIMGCPRLLKKALFTWRVPPVAS